MLSLAHQNRKVLIVVCLALFRMAKQLKSWRCYSRDNRQISWLQKNKGGFVTISNRFQTGDTSNKWKIYIEDASGKVIHNSENVFTKSHVLKLALSHMAQNDAC